MRHGCFLSAVPRRMRRLQRAASADAAARAEPPKGTLMPEIRDYKRSKKLYQSDNFVFVKPRYWPEEVPIDGTDVVVRKEDPMKLRGEVVGYQYVIEDYGEYDPSVPDSDVYDYDVP